MISGHPRQGARRCSSSGLQLATQERPCQPPTLHTGPGHETRCPGVSPPAPVEAETGAAIQVRKQSLPQDGSDEEICGGSVGLGLNRGAPGESVTLGAVTWSGVCAQASAKGVLGGARGPEPQS